MNLSMVPPHSMAIMAISDRYELIRVVRRSGSSESLRSVNFSMSEKKMVRFFLAVALLLSWLSEKML